MAVFLDVGDTLAGVKEVVPGVGAEEVEPGAGNEHAVLVVACGEVGTDYVQDFWDFDWVDFDCQ